MCRVRYVCYIHWTSVKIKLTPWTWSLLHAFSIKTKDWNWSVDGLHSWDVQSSLISHCGVYSLWFPGQSLNSSIFCYSNLNWVRWAGHHIERNILNPCLCVFSIATSCERSFTSTRPLPGCEPPPRWLFHRSLYQQQTPTHSVTLRSSFPSSENEM